MLELAVRVGASLCVVLGLLWATARIGSRRLGGGSRALVRVRGRQALSRTSSLAVVEVGSRVLVVGVSDGGVRLLTELDPGELEVEIPDDVAAVATARGGRRAARRTRPGAVPATALSGSLLSAQTWKQAFAAATSRQRGQDALALVATGDEHE
ncbi:MAG: FliO/MopB family protein [Nocardioidaceae bacterium]